jgi:hypothetical protein
LRWPAKARSGHENLLFNAGRNCRNRTAKESHPSPGRVIGADDRDGNLDLMRQKAAFCRRFAMAAF